MVVYEDLVAYLIPLLSTGVARFNTGQRERHGLYSQPCISARNRWALLSQLPSLSWGSAPPSRDEPG